MLWYKGWLETRSKILFALSFAAFPIPLFTLAAPHAPNHLPEDWLATVRGSVGFFALYYSIVPMLLAGSGIKTQLLQARKGLHGSMYFTLSLPVSRFRILATRAGIGMVEAALILAVAPCAVWIIFAPLRPLITVRDLLAYWVTLSICGSAFYFLGVLLSTFLDDLTQNWTSLLGVVFIDGILSKAPLPAPVNIFRAMGEASPLFTHSLPWASMAIAVGMAATLFSVSMRTV